jgi:hypothetical protein
MRLTYLFIICAIILGACSGNNNENNQQTMQTQSDTTASANTAIKDKLNKYTTVKLEADLSKLTAKEKQMIPLLIEASKVMDELFWVEAYGKKDSLINALSDKSLQQYVVINYGPWDRLANNEPFVEGVGTKPEGANFYPMDITKEEFEKASLPDKTSEYTFLRRAADGKLKTVPYHVEFKTQVEKAADLLKQCAQLAEDSGLKKYLNLRAEALLTDKYQPSDMAWMDMKNNTIDVVIGPIETYEDKLFGYKAAHEAYVLI